MPSGSFEHVAPPVVENDDVQFSARRGAVDQMRVGREFLAGAAAGQEVEEQRQVVDPRKHFFDAHHGHVDRRRGGREAGVAFVLDDHERAGVGHGEVAARDAHAGLEIFVAQMSSGDVGQFFVLGGERFAEFFGEQPAHVGGRHVDGRRDDMHRPLMGQLHDVFAQVGLDGADALGLEHVVQFHLLADHRLRLDHAFDVVFAGDIEDVLVGLGGILGAKHGGAPGGDVPLELDQQLVEIGDGIGFDLMGRLAPVLKVRHRIGHGTIALCSISRCSRPTPAEHEVRTALWFPG